MPQMMPINWITSFIFFISIFIIFIIMNYFIFNHKFNMKANKLLNNNNNKNMIWKW